jgi:maleate isomerase
VWRPDGWDVRWRLGVLVPHADVGPESELRTMAPPDVGIYATRVPFGGIRAGGAMDSTIPLAPVRAFAEQPALDDAAELLSAARLDALAFGFTSSAYVIGASGEGDMLERLRARAGGLPVVAPCAATVDALRALGVSQLALVAPPWFDSELSSLGRAYYEAAGFAVVFSSRCALPSDQALIQPAELYDWIRTHIPDTAEAVAIGGNGFRAVGVIEALEAELGRPVLSANQVLLWAALRAAGAETGSVAGYGRIFAVTP